jgi:hypothetical protein
MLFWLQRSTTSCLLYHGEASKLLYFFRALHASSQVESWAFAVDQEALNLLMQKGVFNLRECKLCKDGVVVMGEYGLSTIILDAGFNIATLMSM